MTLSSTLGVTGDVTITGDLAVNGGDITSTAGTFNLLTAPTAMNFASAVTTFQMGYVGTAGQTVGMFTGSTGNSTYSFATGATASGNTKTLNLGTLGAAGSTSNINIGSTAGGTTILNSPTLRMGSVTTNGVVTAISSNGTLSVLAGGSLNQILMSGAAAPAWSTATFPSTVAANSLLFAKTVNQVEALQFISSDSTIIFDYTVSGKVNVKATGISPSSVVVSGDQVVGSNKSGTYSQTGTTTINVNIVGHGQTTGSWTYLDFTTGAGVDGAYEVTYVDADNFTVQGSVQTTSGNVTAQLGGAGTFTKILTVGQPTVVPTTSLFVKAYDLTQVTKLMEVQDSVGSTKFLIEPSGKTTVNGDLYVQGNIVNTGSGGAVVTQGIVENPVTTTSTSETTILSIAAATYRSVEFQIQAVEGTKFWTSKILAIHDGTNVNWTEYGMAGIGTSPVSSYAVDISAGNIVLKVTSASAASTVYKVVATAILV